MKSKFLSLILLSIAAKKRGNRNFSGSRLGQELEKEITGPPDVPIIQLNPGIYGQNGEILANPIPYEQEFSQESLTPA